MEFLKPRSDAGSNPTRSGMVALVWALALGVFWMLIEFAVGFGSRALFDPGADFGRLLRYLPAQLTLFALIGLPLAALVRWFRISYELVLWLLFGAALSMFLGPSAALGTFRDSRETLQAAWTLAGVGASIAVGLALLAAFGRVLPSNLRKSWPAACVIGLSLVAVPLISRSSARLRLGNMQFQDLPATAHLSDCVLALVVVAAVLSLRPIRQRFDDWGTRKTSASLVALCAFVGSGAQFAIAKDDSEGNGVGDRKHTDVIVILIDTLRPDALGAYGRNPSITPTLDSIASESVVFERVYAASNRTSRSMPAVMTSLAPAVVGERIAEDAVTLAEYLKDAGYTTYGISANPIVSEYYGYDQGFDGFHDPTVAPEYLVMSPLKVLGRFLAGGAYHWGLISAGLYYPTISEIRSRASTILDKTPSPLLLYLHTMDMHGPYLPPKRFLPDTYRGSEFLSYYDLVSIAGSAELMADASRRAQILNAQQRYDGELRFTDEELGHFVEFLRSSGRWDESLIWILSDHGEAFGEHDWTGHAGFNVYSTLLRVPMFVKPPRSAGIRPTTVTAPVSTADFLPTTLAILGLDPPIQSFGINLLDAENRDPRPALREIVSDVHAPAGRILSHIDGQWKLDAFLASDTGELESRALYDLSNDPLQRNDLLAVRPDVVEFMEDACWARLEDERRLSLRRESGAVDADMKERLRSLGYVVD